MTDNLKLWNQISRTNPEYTKQARKGQFSFTAVAPMYQYLRATEIFGPQGLGWGVEPESEKFELQSIGETVLIHYDATLFFTLNGETGRLPIHATEKVAYKTQGANGYLKIDDEVRKKVVTNAKTKGLSELGMCADIFLGEFDNYEYLETRKQEAQIEKAEKSESEKVQKSMEYKESIEGALRMINEAVNMNMLEAAFKQAVIKAKVRGDEATLVKLTKAKDAKKAEMEAKENAKAV